MDLSSLQVKLKEEIRLMTDDNIFSISHILAIP